jgi:hypothetical protein
LLIAGLYNQSREDRKAGRLADAAALVDEMAKRMPNDAETRLLRVESLMLDRKNYAGAIIAVDFDRARTVKHPAARAAGESQSGRLSRARKAGQCTRRSCCRGGRDAAKRATQGAVGFDSLTRLVAESTTSGEKRFADPIAL